MVMCYGTKETAGRKKMQGTTWVKEDKEDQEHVGRITYLANVLLVFLNITIWLVIAC